MPRLGMKISEAVASASEDTLNKDDGTWITTIIDAAKEKETTKTIEAKANLSRFLLSKDTWLRGRNSLFRLPTPMWPDFFGDVCSAAVQVGITPVDQPSRLRAMLLVPPPPPAPPPPLVVVVEFIPSHHPSWTIG